jgi:hypothetical protein
MRHLGLVLAGGNANNWNNAGPCYFNLNNGWGNGNMNIGFRPFSHSNPNIGSILFCNDAFRGVKPKIRRSNVLVRISGKTVMAKERNERCL